ncbi:VOC family protein [Synechococcus sp. CS-1325]|uniref:VOC family protein n=1 Tax=Synechococcus sp. CS-1325 TaxID=2847979 RepID=UPI000DB6DBB2|nr:VOC family protein [Synechococcus sp. CS-1325]MCT0198879.1 VOC family protein [Synechococcus sp. CS-1325]PZV00785.1 MAG: VOC family virulence protein [Cyanobium sp.]
MLRFYTDVLGCSVTKRNERFGMIHLRAGVAQIDLVSTDGELGLAGGAPPGMEGHNVDHICFRIEPFDLEALRVHFLSHGIDLGAVHHNFGAEGYGSAVYLKDPEGNSIELKGPSVQEAGRNKEPVGHRSAPELSTDAPEFA